MECNKCKEPFIPVEVKNRKGEVVRHDLHCNKCNCTYELVLKRKPCKHLYADWCHKPCDEMQEKCIDDRYFNCPDYEPEE